MEHFAKLDAFNRIKFAMVGNKEAKVYHQIQLAESRLSDLQTFYVYFFDVLNIRPSLSPSKLSNSEFHLSKPERELFENTPFPLRQQFIH
jgi:hypothetical protein